MDASASNKKRNDQQNGVHRVGQTEYLMNAGLLLRIIFGSFGVIELKQIRT